MRRITAIALLFILGIFASCAASHTSRGDDEIPPDRLTSSSIAVVSATFTDPSAPLTLRGVVRNGCADRALIDCAVEVAWPGSDKPKGDVDAVDGTFSLVLPPRGGPCSIRVSANGYEDAILTNFVFSPGQAVLLQVDLACSGSFSHPQDQRGRTIDPRSTSSGAVISNWNERTGEPSVHPY